MGYLNRSKVYSQFAGILVALLLSTLGAQANSLPDFVRVIIPSPSKLQISGIITLTADEGYYMCPKWSPDGRNIAFTQAKFVGIEVMNSDGSQRRVLTDELGAGYKFSWSADSKEIAYRVNRPVNGERYSIIKKVHIYTGKMEQLSHTEKDIHPPHWSYSSQGRMVSFVLQGKRMDIPLSIQGSPALYATLAKQAYINKILYFDNDNIWIMDESGSKRKQLTDDIGFDPVWSLDRSKIVYSRWDDLVVMDPSGSSKILLGQGINPCWSPDSKKIVYQISSDDGHKIIASDLFIINADGTERTQLTMTSDEFEVEPCWSPNGHMITYRSERTGQIYSLVLDW